MEIIAPRSKKASKRSYWVAAGLILLAAILSFMRGRYDGASVLPTILALAAIGNGRYYGKLVAYRSPVMQMTLSGGARPRQPIDEAASRREWAAVERALNSSEFTSINR